MPQLCQRCEGARATVPMPFGLAVCQPCATAIGRHLAGGGAQPNRRTP